MFFISSDSFPVFLDKIIALILQGVVLNIKINY